jgi:hypothetical protein
MTHACCRGNGSCPRRVDIVLRSVRSYVRPSRPSRAEWQPPEEYPEPAGPAEIPETEPEQPSPEPLEPPGSPEELPPAPPDSSLGHRSEVPEEPKSRFAADAL